MGTILDPEIYIQYYDSGWHALHFYATQFDVRDAGILKVPSATIYLTEPPSLPSAYDPVRIITNTRGVDDLIFYGRLYNPLRIPALGTTDVDYWRLHCLGLEQRLLQDFITWDYQDEQDAYSPLTKWTYETMIADFLALGDSGYDTGFSLQTDTGAITDAIDGNFNFQNQSLLDALRATAETIGYDGYVSLTNSTPDLNFYELGTINANPKPTITDPCIMLKYYPEDITKTRNFIMVWGGVDRGFPADGDKLTEYAVGKYNPAIWEALNGEAITDYEYTDVDTNIPSSNSYYAVKVDHSGCSGRIKFRLRIDRTAIGSLDLASRFTKIFFWVKLASTAEAMLNESSWWLTLHDSNGNQIKKFMDNRIGDISDEYVYGFYEELWVQIREDLPSTETNLQTTAPSSDDSTNKWWFESGSQFDFSEVEKIDFEVEESTGETEIELLIDLLCFEGGLNIDPFENPDSYPSPAVGGVIKDDTSISNNGLQVLEHIDRDITTFDQAIAEGQRQLNTLKDPFQQIKLSKYSYTQVRPTQVVTLNLSSLGISSQDWRVVEVLQSWRKNEPIITTLDLIYPASHRSPPTVMATTSEPARTSEIIPLYGPPTPDWIRQQSK